MKKLQKSNHQRTNYKFTQFQNIVSRLQSPTLLENELFLVNMEKEGKFVHFKNNIISDLIKIISEKIKTELKTF